MAVLYDPHGAWVGYTCDNLHIMVIAGTNGMRMALSHVPRVRHLLAALVRVTPRALHNRMVELDCEYSVLTFYGA